ncbi:MAG: class I SAM-dependent methyltransferase [Helicobacteraceae bacterium]|jgi:SAM-dependent methyltransferase|nr:class I SAM-dependent methyltransferase [Helicobacteraceae bacterium]
MQRIDEIDFGALYRSHKALCGANAMKAEDWDKRAAKMGPRMRGAGLYNDFIRSKIDLNGAQTLLEIGCGAGSFCFDFAPSLQKVYAFDFSPAMLALLRERQAEIGATNIESFQADIEGDWSGVPICDIVLASRCMEVSDMEHVLKNIDARAKKAVYITAKVGASFWSDELLSAIGREIIPRPDYIYILNILFAAGIYAKVDFAPVGDLQNAPPSTKEAFIEAIAESFDGLKNEEIDRAAAYYDRCVSEGRSPSFRNNAWALIRYEK